MFIILRVIDSSKEKKGALFQQSPVQGSLWEELVAVVEVMRTWTEWYNGPDEIRATPQNLSNPRTYTAGDNMQLLFKFLK